MAGSFLRLDAYRRANALAHELHRSVRTWPKFERWIIGEQLVRAAHGVGANIAEATGRWHLRDRRRFLWMARGSLHETEHWILCAEEQGLLPAGTARRIDEIARPLSGLIKKEPPKGPVAPVIRDP
jgi:four helix bundle protein